VALAICWHSAACFKNSSAGLIGVIGARFLGFPSLLDTIECRTRRTTRLLIPFERASCSGDFLHPRPRLPLPPARLELGLGLVQRRDLIRGPHAPWLAGNVERPEPAQRFGAGAGLVDATDAPLAAEDAVIDGVLIEAVA
jgi:hypothetical protein